MKLYIYTDGAASGNPGRGGFGIVMEYGKHRREYAQGFLRTTNNRMELLAVIVALESLTKTDLDIEIFSDSKYVVDAINKRWLFDWERKYFKGKKNPDLWLRFLPLYRQHRIVFHWIKGHNNHPQNERCDQLAVAASMQENLPPDEGYEKILAANKSLL
ncbi:MAG: ribonuclease HI [Chitinophagales bacterium]|nr:ribonuclease HI [Bacteroidota bacterium]MCB9042767.1 ribonuclease HI [Chitinophagales bacterium]